MELPSTWMKEWMSDLQLLLSARKLSLRSCISGERLKVGTYFSIFFGRNFQLPFFDFCLTFTIFLIGALTDYYIALGVNFLGHQNFAEKKFFWCSGETLKFT